MDNDALRIPNSLITHLQVIDKNNKLDIDVVSLMALGLFYNECSYFICSALVQLFSQSTPKTVRSRSA